MATVNKSTKQPPIVTHEGGRAVRINLMQQLRRSVMACMLWENTFYESGEEIADRIASLVAAIATSKEKAQKVLDLALEARTKFKLRHAPLLLVREVARVWKWGSGLDAGIAAVIQRADELAEFVSIYWKDKKQPLTNQIKRGLATAFGKFSAYDLAKYDRAKDVRLRDVLFLTHPKPKDKEQEELWKGLVDGTLPTPDTWETRLSGGADKLQAWTELLADKKLGALAFLRNLRNMKDAMVPKLAVSMYANRIDLSRVLPFRFVAAAHAVPAWEDICDTMLLRASAQAQKLPGKTVLVIDVSGSMYGHGNISARSDITRVEAAGALAAIMREQCEDARIYATAGNDSSRVHATAEVPPRRGMALVELFTKQGFTHDLGGGGIFLAQCLAWIKPRELTADRIIVFTDEQDCDLKLKPTSADAFGTRNYLVNISVERNGIGYKPKWTHIDGFSEAIVDYIIEAERAVSDSPSDSK